MQHRMLKEAQKAMVPWMHGQPIYAPISSNASSQGVPILYSGEQHKTIIMLYWRFVDQTRGRIRNPVLNTLYCTFKCFHRFILYWNLYHINHSVLLWFSVSNWAHRHFGFRLVLGPPCRTELCHGSHADAPDDAAAATTPSSSPSCSLHEWQWRWQCSRRPPSVGLPGKPGERAGCPGTSNGSTHCPKYAPITASDAASSSHRSLHTRASKHAVSPWWYGGKRDWEKGDHPATYYPGCTQHFLPQGARRWRRSPGWPQVI